MLTEHRKLTIKPSPQVTTVSSAGGKIIADYDGMWVCGAGFFEPLLQGEPPTVSIDLGGIIAPAPESLNQNVLP